mgnify:CR=1 FL=1
MQLFDMKRSIYVQIALSRLKLGDAAIKQAILDPTSHPLTPEQLGALVSALPTAEEAEQGNALQLALKMNEAVQEQVATLKTELQGTLKALETWILEQNTKKTHGMKLQPKPADEPPGSSKSGLSLIHI